MNFPLNRLTGLALGCLVSVAVVGCARNATEPPQRSVEAAPVVAPAPPPAPAPQVVAVAPPGPVVAPLAESAPPASTNMGAATTANANTMTDMLPPRADRN